METATNMYSRELSDGKRKVVGAMTEEKNTWCLAISTILAITIGTRYYKVTEPDHVCWDETHFGKMGSWYINRTFFFDVHPPLGKMLIGMSGYLTGYKGDFPFEKPGDKFGDTPYEGMRYFCTTMGALIVPLAFDTVYSMTRSIEAAIVSAAYLLFDVGMLTLNRYILLDPILLCFMMASVWGMVKVSVTTSKGSSYTWKWWFYLLFTGTMLACTISVKFVGLFVVLLVGFHTIYEIWVVLGDIQISIWEAVKQLLCRSLALIVWPIILYLTIFYIHLHVLNRSGSGDGFYSSAFQSRLIGNSLYNASMPRNVAYGSVVTIKNHKTGGGYLHSHLHLYPKGIGSRQQQITSYTHKDENNAWLVKPHDKDTLEHLTIVKNGDLVRLEHVPTRRNLHSHNEPAPLSKTHMQVTGYGEKGNGDANDIWKIVIIDGKQNEAVKTVTTKFKLIHYLQGCALTSSGKQLPKWGFEQQEITCNTNIRDPYAKWNVEENKNSKLTSENFNVYAPGFVARFIESHAVMFQGNAGLKPKDGEITSRPWHWPINLKGQFFSGNDHRIYLLGNPIVWWSNLIFLNLFVIIFITRSIKRRRREAKSKISLFKGSPDNYGSIDRVSLTDSNALYIVKQLPTDKAHMETQISSALWLYVGWAIHYLPFWIMGRVLYFHHYFPALAFNSMLTGVMFYYTTCRLQRGTQICLLILLMFGLVYSFKLFSPLAYGMSGPSGKDSNSKMNGLKWLPTWEF